MKKNTFSQSQRRWKSEELMYKCLKEIYGNKVIFQYRPFFLKTNKGQLSYDSFILGKNIAFEYQGKQHFEPVDFFGGEEHFRDQVRRDKLKQKLSIENNVDLIYINYWENISIDLIKQKIRNHDNK